MTLIISFALCLRYSVVHSLACETFWSYRLPFTSIVGVENPISGNFRSSSHVSSDQNTTIFVYKNNAQMELVLNTATIVEILRKKSHLDFIVIRLQYTSERWTKARIALKTENCHRSREIDSIVTIRSGGWFRNWR